MSMDGSTPSPPPPPPPPPAPPLPPSLSPLTQPLASNNETKTIIALIKKILLNTKLQKKNRSFTDFLKNFYDSIPADAVDTENYNEIIPNLYLGDCRLAMNKEDLKKLGFTHILNCAEGRKYGQINTCRTYYEDVQIQYTGFNIIDIITYDISKHFQEASDFLHEALSNKKNKVYVHCQQGISRSATLVIAYLVSKYNMTLMDAIQLVSSRRRIWPNEGFLTHLIDYETKTKRGQELLKSEEDLLGLSSKSIKQSSDEKDMCASVVNELVTCTLNDNKNEPRVLCNDETREFQ